MSGKNYYDILGVDKGASEKDIKKAYRKLVLKCHPDKYPTEEKDLATKRFHEIQEAYETLSDDSKRKTYDAVGHDNYKQGFNGAQGFSGAQGFDFSGFNFSGSGFDFFSDMFGGFAGNGGFSSKNESGDDLRCNLELTLEQAFNGCICELKVPRYVCCSVCVGSGFNKKSTARVCNKCRGNGKINVQQFLFQITQVCDKCLGSGKVYDNCLSCSGSGRLYENSLIKVSVPAGVKHEMKLRMANEGGFVKGGGVGDLHIFVFIKKHKVFKVDGADLLVTLPITIFDVLLGVELNVPGIDGKPCLVKVLPGTQPNSKLVISRAGMSKLGTSLRGDLVISFDVEIPKNLSSEEKDLVLKFKEAYLRNSKNKSLFEKLYSYWTS